MVVLLLDLGGHFPQAARFCYYDYAGPLLRKTPPDPQPLPLQHRPGQGASTAPCKKPMFGGVLPARKTYTIAAGAWKDWVAGKELELSRHNKGALLCTRYPCYVILLQVP